MPLTLGLTGMDPATETALQAAFKQANSSAGESFSLMPEADADYVVVDMDSMYGPMSWLRLHGAGKTVIGLTSAPRTQADFRLGRPFDANTLQVLLGEIVSKAGAPVASAPAPSPTLAAAPASSAEETAPAAVPSGLTHAPAPQDLLPEEQVEPLDPETIAPPSPEPAPVPVVAPTPASEPTLGDWLLPNALQQRLRYRRGAGPSLLLDPQSRQYHGPATLKPLAAYFEGSVRLADFDAIDAATWIREAAAAGDAQPLSRLQWYGGLLAGKGELLPGNDPAGRYRLNKWPQTEREFPKHFRIATAMMKGPATLDEIVAASGVPAGDVADFVNANLVTGFAESVPDLPPEPAEPAKPGGLFGRLRGR
ncbi:hypothetical protein IP90_01180 [Luteimonas cucumeris]|uniref:Uncharacterized protein n=1 Tax=Luteimonas cucumeris TaxID=985012 RepID=A0A562LBK4_9GAMM|nr:hypothetical protein [Luteimonas cucumeris]TWI05037.1 hypothetical protein IP90_01180 [Luteimonas cucumeris]